MLGRDGRRRVSGARNELCSRQPSSANKIYQEREASCTHETQHFRVAFVSDPDIGIGRIRIRSVNRLRFNMLHVHHALRKSKSGHDHSKVEYRGEIVPRALCVYLKITYKRSFFSLSGSAKSEKDRKKPTNKPVKPFQSQQPTFLLATLPNYLMCPRHVI